MPISGKVVQTLSNCQELPKRILLIVLRSSDSFEKRSILCIVHSTSDELLMQLSIYLSHHLQFWCLTYLKG